MTTLPIPSRRSFMTMASAGFVVLTNRLGAFAQVTPTASTAAQAPGGTPPPRPDPLASSMVQEFVRKAHSDIAATKSLLAEQPGLLNATWDWGGGDFETGIGGAGHMGNREIAEYLIGQGARLDIFDGRHAGASRYRPGAAHCVARADPIEGPSRHFAHATRTGGEGRLGVGRRLPRIARGAIGTDARAGPTASAASSRRATRPSSTVWRFAWRTAAASLAEALRA